MNSIIHLYDLWWTMVWLSISGAITVALLTMLWSGIMLYCWWRDRQHKPKDQHEQATRSSSRAR